MAQPKKKSAPLFKFFVPAHRVGEKKKQKRKKKGEGERGRTKKKKMSLPFGVGDRVPDDSEAYSVFSMMVPMSETGSTGYMNGISRDGPYFRLVSAFCELFRKQNVTSKNVTMVLRAVVSGGAHLGYDVMFWLKNTANTSPTPLLSSLDTVFLSEIVAFHAENSKTRVSIDKVSFNNAWMCFESGVSGMAESLSQIYKSVAESFLVYAPVSHCFFQQDGVAFTSPRSKEPTSRCWAKTVPSWSFSDFGTIEWPHHQLSKLNATFGMSDSLTELAKALGPQGIEVVRPRASKRQRFDAVRVKEAPQLSASTRKQMAAFLKASGLKGCEDPETRKVVAQVSAWYRFRLLPSLTEAMIHADCLSPAQDGFRAAMETTFESEFGTHRLLDTVWMARHLSKLKECELPPHLWFFQYFLVAMQCYPKVVGTELIAMMGTLAGFDACNMEKGLGLSLIGYSSSGQTGKSNAFLKAMEQLIKGAMVFMGRSTVASYTPETIIGSDGRPMRASFDCCVLFCDDANPLLPFIVPGHDANAAERTAQKEMATSRLCAYAGLNFVANPDGIGSQRIRQEVYVSACANRITALNLENPEKGKIDHAWWSRFLPISFPENGFTNIANARQEEAMSRVKSLIEGLTMVTHFQHISHYIIGQMQHTGLLPKFTSTGAVFFMTQVFQYAREKFEWAVISSPRTIDRMLRLSQVLAINRLVGNMTARLSVREGVSTEVTMEHYMALAPQMIVSWADMCNALCLNDEWVNPFAFSVQAAVRAAIISLSKAHFDNLIKGLRIDGVYEKDYNYFSIPIADLINEVSRALPEYMGGAIASKSAIATQLDAMCDHPPIKAPTYWRIHRDFFKEAIGVDPNCPETNVYPYSKAFTGNGRSDFVVSMRVLASEFVLEHFNERFDKLGKDLENLFEDTKIDVMEKLDGDINAMEGAPTSSYARSLKHAASGGAEKFIEKLNMAALNPDSPDFAALDPEQREELADWLRRRFFWHPNYEPLFDEPLAAGAVGAPAGGCNVVAVLRKIKQEFAPEIYLDHFNEVCHRYLQLYKKVSKVPTLSFDRLTGKGARIDFYRNKERKAPAVPPAKNLTLNTRETVRDIIAETVNNRGQLKRTCNLGPKMEAHGLNTGRVQWAELGEGPADYQKGPHFRPFRIPRIDKAPAELGERDIALVEKYQEFEGEYFDVETDLDTKTLNDHFQANDLNYLQGFNHRDMTVIGELMVSDALRRVAGERYMFGQPVATLIPPQHRDIPDIARALKAHITGPPRGAFPPPLDLDFVPPSPLQEEEEEEEIPPPPIEFRNDGDFAMQGEPPESGDEEEEVDMEAEIASLSLREGQQREQEMRPAAAEAAAVAGGDEEVFFDLKYMQYAKEQLELRKIPPQAFGVKSYDEEGVMYKISCHPWVTDYIQIK